MQHNTLQTRDQEQLHFFSTGSGEPVIFLHGWSTTHDLTEPLMEEIAGQYHAIAWDARGHGAHPYRLTTPPTVDQLIDDLNELLDHLGLDQVRLVGHSMWAAILWGYLRKYGSARVKQTVVIDMTPKLTTDADWKYGVYFDFPPERQRWFLEEMQSDIVEAVLRLRAYGRNPKTRALYETNDPALAPYRAFLSRVNPAALISIWQDLLTYDFRDFLPGLTTPTLLIYGGASQFYGEELANWMLNTLPKAELLLFPEGDHGPHIQYPREVGAKLLDFFADRPNSLHLENETCPSGGCA